MKKKVKQNHILKLRGNITRNWYKKYYNIDISDDTFYDLIIDSTNKIPEEIVEIILREIDK